MLTLILTFFHSFYLTLFHFVLKATQVVAVGLERVNSLYSKKTALPKEFSR